MLHRCIVFFRSFIWTMIDLLSLSYHEIHMMYFKCKTNTYIPIYIIKDWLYHTDTEDQQPRKSNRSCDTQQSLGMLSTV